MSKTRNQTYKVGDIVMVDYRKELYPAKVDKVDMTRKQDRFFHVHYAGWASSWDQWVPNSKMYEPTSEQVELYHVRMATESKKTQRKDNRTEKKRAAGSDATSPAAKSPAKKVKSSSSESSDTVKVGIDIPDALKTELIQEWEHILKKREVCSLPCSPSAKDVVDSYLREQSDGVSQSIMTDLLTFFDASCEKILLYTTERENLKRAKSFKKSPAECYSGLHLLRLFVKLPELLEPVDEQVVSLLEKHLSRFLSYIQQHTNLLKVDYTSVE